MYSGWVCAASIVYLDLCLDTEDVQVTDRHMSRHIGSSFEKSRRKVRYVCN